MNYENSITAYKSTPYHVTVQIRLVARYAMSNLTKSEAVSFANAILAEAEKIDHEEGTQH